MGVVSYVNSVNKYYLAFDRERYLLGAIALGLAMHINRLIRYFKAILSAFNHWIIGLFFAPSTPHYKDCCT